MTKEQEEAIEILTKKVDRWKCKRPRNPIIFNGLIDEIDTENNAIETVLNMLKDQQRKIENYEKKNRDLSNQILMLYKEQDNYNTRINDLEYALLDMVMQFADRPNIKGSNYALNTMGLSALELAFDVLGFDDPYPIKKAEEKYKILAKQYFERKSEK